MLDTEPVLIEQYVRSGQVRLIYRHLQQLGPRSELLSEASECAADQGRFWQMRYSLYDRYNEILFDAEGELAAAAGAAGLDPQALSDCLAAGTHRERVRADYAAAQAEGVRSRPVFRIGEQTIVGAQRLSVFQQALDQALAGR